LIRSRRQRNCDYRDNIRGRSTISGPSAICRWDSTYRNRDTNTFHLIDQLILQNWYLFRKCINEENWITLSQKHTLWNKIRK